MNIPITSKLHLTEQSRIDNTSDLSGYFFYHSVDLLSDGGILGFISSETWMNSKYDLSLQKMILDNTTINQTTHSNFNVFDEADTRTAIVILQRNIKDVNEAGNNKCIFNLSDTAYEIKNSVFLNTKNMDQNQLKIGNWITYFKPTLPAINISLIKLFSVENATYGEITGYKKNSLYYPN